MLKVMENPWALTHERLLAEYHTSRTLGLSEAEAKRRLRHHGFNELKVRDAPSAGRLLLRQLQSPLVWILLVASIVSVIQHEVTNAIVIGVVVVLNAGIGLLQEYKAERTIHHLNRLISRQARVVRDGVEAKVDARGLVPGDLLVVEAGDRVPADARLLEAVNIRVNEAALTGEAVPAHKKAGVVPVETRMNDRVNMLFSSTLVVAGRGLAVVTKTGMGTELGRLSLEVARVKSQPTLLQRKMKHLAQLLLGFSLVLVIGLFVFGVIKQIPIPEMLTTTLSLLVAIVPEGLPIAVTVVLSVGLLRMYRHRTLIRQLSAAETLGSATVIGVDKTGTLTEGAMMVEKLLIGAQEITVTGQGYGLSGEFLRERERLHVTRESGLKLMLELASLSTTSTISQQELLNDEAKSLTDPTETAIAVVAAKAGFYAFKEERNHPELLEIPFDQERRYSASVHGLERVNRYIVKGSPEKLLELSTHSLTARGERRRLLTATRSEIEDRVEQVAGQGYRLVGIAYSDHSKREAVDARRIKELTLVGFLALADPIRSDVASAIKKAHQAGVRVIMITGDHLLTARSIAHKIGLDQWGTAIHASDLKYQDLAKVSVVARATPAEKLRIVEKLQKAGEIVGMTGDGVNDAPALKKADIGIAMGRTGTDVAIEASAMVLLADNFSAIIRSIEQGRLIWENLRKVIFYLISTTLGEIAIVVTSLLLGLPLPLVAVQILWMNLITDSLMSVALTVEPEESHLMARPPASPDTPLVDASMIRRMVWVSLVMGVGSLFVYWVFLPQGIEYARSATLMTMVLFQLLNVFNARSAVRSIFERSPGRNRLLWPSLGAALIVQLLAIYWPLLQSFLGTVALDGQTILIIVAVATSIILADELRKALRGAMLNWAKVQQSLTEVRYNKPDDPAPKRPAR